MRIFIILSVFTLFAASFSITSCKSEKKLFCDTTCNNDTLRLTIDHPAQPFISIGMKNCMPDTITWSHKLVNIKRKVPFTTLTGQEIKINKSHIRYFFKDTSYVWLILNECENGQGYVFKLPYEGTGTIIRKNSAFNSFDPKFIVDESMVAYTDKGNIFVEEMATGKKAMMTFGVKLENLDYTNIHETIDSVIVSPTHIRARINIDNTWKVVESNIKLQ